MMCILTNAIYDVKPQFAAITDRRKDVYCARHGMTFISLQNNPHPESHPVWCKPSLMAWALEQYDWAVWMDADAAPMNCMFDLPAYLNETEEPLVMGKDINGFNNGVFAVRSDARWWLLKIDARRGQYRRGFREQQAMADSIACGEIKCRIPDLSIGWNDYIPSLYNRSCDENVYRRGESFVLHLPALSEDIRLKVFMEED